MQGAASQPLEIKLTYEIISRVSNFILIIYKNDFVQGSLLMDTQQELDEWLEKMKLIGITQRDY